LTDIKGVHHVAIGIKDLEAMKRFYTDVLGFKRVLVEIDDSEKNNMSDTMRGALPVIFDGAMLQQEAGGVVVELIHMIAPAPRPIRRNPAYGDIGVAKVSVTVPDVEQFYGQQKGVIPFCSEPQLAKIPQWGDYRFVFCRDPEGNLIEFVSHSDILKTISPGAAGWASISVTDLDRSMDFYKNTLGFDITVIEPHECFSGLVDGVSGHAGTRVRSCMLGSSKARAGEGTVELFEVMEPRGRSIPLSAMWGDYGYLQVCFSYGNIGEAVERLEKDGVEFISGHMVMPDGGEFVYLKDVDGIPLEHLFMP